MPSELGEDSDHAPSPAHSESSRPSKNNRRKDARPCHEEADKMINFLLRKLSANYEKKGISPEVNEESSIRSRYKNLEKEILSVCRRINRAKKDFPNKSSKGLLDVFHKEDESICLVIKRNQDGRIQVDGRKVWPHAFMYHIFKTFIKGDASRSYCGSHSELRTKSTLETPCQFPFSNERSEEQTHLCINPFHYEEKLKIDVNHYVKKPCTSPKVLQWKNEEYNQPEKLAATLIPSPVDTSSKQKEHSKNSTTNDKTQDTVLIDSDILPHLSQSEKLWQKPVAPSRNFSIENAKGIINYHETVSKAYEKRSMHNTRSRSPRESRRGLPNLSDEHFYNVAEIKSQLEGVNLQNNSPAEKPLALSQPEPQEKEPPVEEIQNEETEMYTMAQPILLIEEKEKPWCQVNFYECNKKVDFYSSNKNHVDIYYPSEIPGSSNRYKKNDPKFKQSPNFDVIDLSSISNVNRAPETWDLLEKLNKGITLIYDRDRRIVSCQNKCKSLKVYVLSYLMNVECGKHEQSLIQVSPGATRVVYDGWQLAKTIDGINSQTQNDLEKWVLVGQYANYFTVFRISFQPWGPSYAKKRLTECDAWLEIQMREYLDWIHQIENHYEYVLHDSRFDQPETTPLDEDYTPLPIAYN